MKNSQDKKLVLLRKESKQGLGISEESEQSLDLGSKLIKCL